MGRHSATSRLKPQLKRTASNALEVLFVSAIVTVFMLTGIATIAAIEANKLPEPTVTAADYEMPTAQQAADARRAQAHGKAVAPAQQEAVSQPTQELRRCPATGCTASTCHAETGEPIPRH